MIGTPIRLHRLPPRLFPMKIEAFRCDDRALVWSARLSEPQALYIPPLARIHKCMVAIRITYADGTVSEA